MATKHKDPAPAGNKEIKRGASPMSSTHKARPRPPSPSGISVVAKDHAKTHGPPKTSTMSGDQASNKHVPNYLKPTVSSKTDVGKPAVGRKQHSHDDMHKPNTMSVRRRSFDKPVPASQVHKAIHQSSSTGRVAAPISVKNSMPLAAKPNNASSSERVSKVVRAVKSQPPLVKTKSLPKGVIGSSRKEVTKKTKKALEQTPNIVKYDAEEEESLDVNDEEELARLESPGEPHDLLPTEKHSEDHVADVENHSPLAAAQCAGEHNHHEEQEQEHEPECEGESVKVSNQETQEVYGSQNVDEIKQQSNGEIEETSAENDSKKEEDEEIMKAHAEVGLTVKTSPDEVAEGEEQGEEEKQSAKSEPATSVVHKRQIGGPINKKESPVYNDVIEETASKLVEKRVNKVRALAGAFETVISLEQPHSS